MMEKGVTTRSKITSNVSENNPETSQVTLNRSRSRTPSPHGEEGPEVSLRCILNELREFRKDNMEQFDEFKQDLKRTNDRLEEAEERIEETETTLQLASTLIKRLIQRQANLEARVLDQEGRARRDNLRIYGIPEDKEGTDMIEFLNNLLKNALDLPRDRELGIERAHRALQPKPSNPEAKPRSKVVKFSSYRTKEEVLRKAWQRKKVYFNDTRFFVDHDFPLEVLKKRGEYVEVKKVLKEKQIKFQTPYPARMRVFYEDGTQLYQSATEATKDLVKRGFTVAVVKPSVAIEQEEITAKQLTTWQPVLKRRDRGEDQRYGEVAGDAQPKKASRSQYKEKLKQFRK